MAVAIYGKRSFIDGIGIEIRSFGFETGTDLFAGTDLTILAEAGAECKEDSSDSGPGNLGPSPAGLVGYWPFDTDEGSPFGTASDESGNGNDGTVEGATLTADGDGVGGGKAAKFDSGEEDQIKVDGLVTQSQAVTLTGWVKRDEDSGNGCEVVSIGDYIGLRGYDDSGEVRGFFHEGNEEWKRTTADAPGAEEWQHLAYVLDTENNTQKLYVNGEKKTETTHSEDVQFKDLGSNTVIGDHGDSKDFGWEGELDEVRVYDRALSGAEIETLSNEFDP